MTMQRWKLTVEYKGTGYYGWQRQDDGPTIQGAIEDAVYKFCQQRLTVQGSGRTDAGVHALAQIAHLDLDYGERDLSGHDLAKAINAHLRPQPITVINAVKVSQDFHARFSAKKKLYHYRIVNRRAFLTRDQDLAWRFKRPLDPVAMHDAAQILLGHHDFSTFRDSECQAQSPEKTLDQLDVTAHDYDGHGGTEIIIKASAKSFLHHQVRNIVGSLTMVGEKKWSKDDLQNALKARDRQKGGMTAPAEGLYMVRAEYDEA